MSVVVPLVLYMWSNAYWSELVCDFCGADIPYTVLGLRSMSSCGGVWPAEQNIIICLDPRGSKAHGFIVHAQIFSLVKNPYTGLGLRSMSSCGGVWSVGDQKICNAILIISA